ncbi:DsbA family protein [Brevibacterium sp. R8603A2]|uniref:DsbA family protein n=1 Tax=Brevibacterium sp. R8603A2 TaxID=2929779 RepID=UPI001FF7A6C8|nr:thioredoxin domain-containing protein [Brevibacterium sp. R8603A2]MCK1801725.1 DsbA family protein [Brevibacterium sp. R8603A2]
MAKNSSSAADRRQAAREKARQIAEAQAKREKTARTVLYTGVGVVVVAVIAVIAFLIYQAAQPTPGPKNYSAGSITLASDGESVQAYGAKGASGDDAPADAPAFTESGLPDTAPVVTVFMDFQCPGCAGFEQANGQTLDKLVEEGTIAVEYQPVAILDAQSQGNEYSTRAANLMACVADSGQAGTYMDLTKILFENQPGEGQTGMTDEQLLGFAEEAGVDTSAATTVEDGATVQQCVENVSFDKFVENTTQDALSNGLQGTPRVLVNGEDTDSWQDPQGFATELLTAAGEIG